jgi:hypothetical protein
VDVALGDSVTVDLAEHDIDRSLRIVKRREVIEAASTIFATLTNRVPERGGDRKRRDDLERFNSGYQGFVDRDVDSYGWQPVDSVTNATRPYPYPSDVVREDVAEVVVNSIPYRAYSSGAASGGGAFVTSQNGGTNADTTTNNANFANVAAAQQDLTFSNVDDTQWYTLDSFTPSADTSELYVFGTFTLQAGDATNEYVFRVNNTGDGTYVPSASGFNTVFGEDFYRGVWAVEATNTNGDAVEFQIQSVPSSTTTVIGRVYWLGTGQHTHNFDWLHDHDVDVPDHTHTPEPGIVDFPTETASGADLLVNGNTVQSNIGTGEFTTTVDISGELSSGDNTIELASDTLGLVNLTVRTQLFRSG